MATTVTDLPLHTVLDESDEFHIIDNLSNVDKKTTLSILSEWVREQADDNIVIQNSTPNLRLLDDDAALDEKIYDWLIDGGTLKGVTRKDDLSNETSWIEVARTAESPTEIKLRTSNTDRIVIGSTGNVAFDTNVLFVDSVNNRIGIGTTTPDVKTHIEVGSQIGGSFGDAATAIKITGTGDASSVYGGIVWDFSGTAGGAGEEFGIYGSTAGGTDRLYITYQQGVVATFNSNGLFGIGTDNPVGDKLNITDTTANADVGIRIENDAIAWRLLTKGSLTDSFVIRDNNAALDRFIITTAGNVGIGTTSPDAKVEVVGGVTQLLLSDTEADTTGKNSRIAIKHYNIAEEPFTYVLGAVTSTDNILNLGGGTSAGNSATLVRFFTSANTTTLTGTERMRIDSSGNVAIGNTTPKAPMHVGAAASALGFILPDGSILLSGAQPRLALFDNDASADNRYWDFLSVGETLSFRTAEDNGVSPTNWLTVDRTGTVIDNVNLPNGNVVIGNTGSGSAQLHVGDVATGFTAYTTAGRQLLSAPDPALGFWETDGAADNRFWQIGTNNGQFQMYAINDVRNVATLFFSADRTGTVIDNINFPNGNVGINVVSPTEKFEVNGSINAIGQSTNFNLGAARALMDFDTTNKIARYGALSGATTFTGAEGAVVFLAADAEAVRIASSGDVAIGNTSPSAQLHVGDAAIGLTSAPGSGRVLFSGNDPWLALYEVDASNDNGHWINVARSEQLLFQAVNDAVTVSSTWLTVDRTGTNINDITFTGDDINLVAPQVFIGTAGQDNTIIMDPGSETNSRIRWDDSANSFLFGDPQQASNFGAIRRRADTLSVGSPTQNQYYDTFSAWVVDTNDQMPVSGCIEIINNQRFFILSHVRRSGASTINMFGIEVDLVSNLVGPVSYGLTDGSAAVIGTQCHVSIG